MRVNEYLCAHAQFWQHIFKWFDNDVDNGQPFLIHVTSRCQYFTHLWTFQTRYGLGNYTTFSLTWKGGGGGGGILYRIFTDMLRHSN